MTASSSNNQTQPLANWHPLLAALFAIFFVLVVYFFSQFFGSLVVSMYPVLRHWSHAQAVAWLNHAIWAQFVYILIAEALTMGALYLFLHWREAGWRAIGWRRPKWSDLGWGLAFLPLYYLTYFAVIIIVHAFVPHLNLNQPQQIGFSEASGLVNLSLTFISLVVLPPLVEETLMRGFLYTSLKQAGPRWSAVLITSIMFALAHLEFGSGAPLLWVAFINTFILSLFLIHLREKTNGLWAGITVHAGQNCLAFIMLFVLNVR